MTRCRPTSFAHLARGLVAVAIVSVGLAWWSPAAPTRIDIGNALVEQRASTELTAGHVEVPTVRIVAQACHHVTYGTGIVVDGERVLTANHVVAGASSVAVETADGRRLSATAVTRDAGGRDAALVAVPGVGGAAILGGSLPEGAGATVAVVGHPHGGARQVTFAAVRGLVSRGPLALDGHRVLQVDAPFVSGMSGGPVLDREQRVVAVAIAVDHVSNTGLAVPVADLAELLADTGTPVVPVRCAD